MNFMYHPSTLVLYPCHNIAHKRNEILTTSTANILAYGTYKKELNIYAAVIQFNSFFFASVVDKNVIRYQAKRRNFNFRFSITTKGKK